MGSRITTAGDDGAPPRVGGRGRLALGRPVSLDEAERLSPGPLPRPGGLGTPSAVFAGRPAGGVTLVWAPDDALPAVLDHGVGLLVTAFPGRVQQPEPVIGKRTSDGGAVEPVRVDGEPAYWVAGEPHEMTYLDEEGTLQEDTARLSGNTLMWTRDGVTYRLESALPLPDALRLAESLPG